MSHYRWRIWCNADSRWEEVTSDTVPTTCPTNAGHTVNLNSASKLRKIQKVDKIMMADSTSGKVILQKNNYHFVSMTAVLVDDFWKLDNDMWSVTTDGSGSSVAIDTMSSGVLNIDAGNINGNSAMIVSKNPIASSDIAPIYEIRGKLSANNEQTLELGMSNNDDKEIIFIYDATTTVGNILAKCKDDLNVTTLDTGIVADTDWHKYSIDVLSGNAVFSIDGTTVASITNSIPDGTISLHQKLSCKNGGQRTFQVDFVKFSSDRQGYAEGSGRRGGFLKHEKM